MSCKHQTYPFLGYNSNQDIKYIQEGKLEAVDSSVTAAVLNCIVFQQEKACSSAQLQVMLLLTDDHHPCLTLSSCSALVYSTGRPSGTNQDFDW
jgi:hypothetical protein